MRKRSMCRMRQCRTTRMRKRQARWLLEDDIVWRACHLYSRRSSAG
jgi:hypothetical protein